MGSHSHSTCSALCILSELIRQVTKGAWTTINDLWTTDKLRWATELKMTYDKLKDRMIHWQKDREAKDTKVEIEKKV